MRNCVTVSAAARLHLGFLDLNGGLGRRFGSLGAGARRARNVARAEPKPRQIASDGPQAERADALSCRASSRISACRAVTASSIHEAIPAHAGLGSGTQLALAVAAGAAHACMAWPRTSQPTRLLLERGARSGLGARLLPATAASRSTAAAADDDRPAPIIARLPFPEDWRVLLILDPAAAGRARRGGDRRLPGAAAVSGGACRASLPARADAGAAGRRRADLPRFGRAVTEIQAHVGDHFSAAQGGRYASPGCRSGARAPRGERRRGLWPELLGADRLCLRRDARRGAHAGSDLATPLAAAVGPGADDREGPQQRRGRSPSRAQAAETGSAAWLSPTSCT